MSIDDQLYKDDGSWITKADISILMFARKISNHLIGDEKETYDQALKTLLRMSAIISTPVIALNLSWEPKIYLAILTVVWSVGLVVASHFEKCNSRGSTIDRELKYLALFSVTIVMAIILFTVSSGPQQLDRLLWLSSIILFTSMLGFIFTMFYVQRLGAPPPRKKKAKVHRLAWHH